MPIAVTAHIATSPTLRAALAAFGLLHAALAIGIPAGWLGAFHHPALIASVHACAAAACLVCALQRQTPRRVDVSGPGQITVTVQHGLRRRTATGKPMRAVAASGPVPVRLLPGSTFLPGMLVLDLADAQGARLLLVVLPDAVSGDPFRRLAAALRCIAARDEPESIHPKFVELIAGGQAPRQ